MYALFLFPLIQLQEAFQKGDLQNGLTVKVAVPRTYSNNTVSKNMESLCVETNFQ